MARCEHVDKWKEPRTEFRPPYARKRRCAEPSTVTMETLPAYYPHHVVMHLCEDCARQLPGGWAEVRL